MILLCYIIYIYFLCICVKRKCLFVWCFFFAISKRLFIRSDYLFVKYLLKVTCI